MIKDIAAIIVTWGLIPIQIIVCIGGIAFFGGIGVLVIAFVFKLVWALLNY